jgi:hypothetical protein
MLLLGRGIAGVVTLPMRLTAEGTELPLMLFVGEI